MGLFRDAINQEMETYQHITVEEGDYTIGAFVSAVMKIENPSDAKDFWDGYLIHQTAASPDLDARDTCRSNIGWCFGEGMANERKQMWIEVCGASHPVFGTMTPTPEEAFQAGLDAAKATP